MANLSDRNQSSEFMRDREARIAPRPSSKAPVLFTIPNLRIDSAHLSRPQSEGSTVREPSPPIASSGPIASSAKATQSSNVSTAVAPQEPPAKLAATSADVPPAPTYVPIPAPIATQHDDATKTWYAGWSNRFIILLLVAMIGVFGFRAMQSPSNTEKIMADQGIQEENLNPDIEFPSFPPTSENPQTNTFAIGFPSNESTESKVSTESPSKGDSGDRSQDLLIAQADGNAAGQESTDRVSNEMTIPNAPDLDFGTPTQGSPSTPSQDGKNGKELVSQLAGPRGTELSFGKPSSKNDDMPLEAPPLDAPSPNNPSLNSAGLNNTGLNSGNSGTPNQAGSNDVANGQRDPLQGNSPEAPAITETQYEGLSTAALLAARRERLNQLQSSAGVPGANDPNNYRTTLTSVSPGQTNVPNPGAMIGSIPTNAMPGNYSPNTSGYAPANTMNTQPQYNPTANTGSAMKYRPVGAIEANVPSTTMLTGQSYPPATPMLPGIPVPGTNGTVVAPASPQGNLSVQGTTGNTATANPATPPRTPYQPIGPALAPGYSAPGGPMSPVPNGTLSPGGYIPVQGTYSTSTMTNPNLANPNGMNPGLGLIPGTQPYYPQAQGVQPGQPMQQPTMQQPTMQQPNMQMGSQPYMPSMPAGYGGAR